MVHKWFVDVVYENNMMKIKPRFDFVNLGTICDVDGTKYQVSEIQFKTPAEHSIDSCTYDMEV